jgi:hypothetical protein
LARAAPLTDAASCQIAGNRNQDVLAFVGITPYGGLPDPASSIWWACKPASSRGAASARVAIIVCG